MSTRAVTIGAAALLFATAPAAWADLTAEGLWVDWQETYGAFGVRLSAEAAAAGGVLTLSDFTVATDTAGVESVTNYGTIRLVEGGDGTVRVEIPGEIRAVSFTTVEGETVEQPFIIRQDGLDILVSEEGEARDYLIEAQRFAYIFDDLSTGEAEAPVEMSVTLTEVASRYTIAPEGALSSLATTTTAEGVNFEIKTEGEQSFTLLYDAIDLSGEGGGTFDAAGAEAGRMLPGGLDMDLSYAHGGSTMTFTARSDEGPVNVNSASSAGTLAVGIDGDGLTETLSSLMIQASIQVPQLPVPLTLTAGELAGGFVIPVGAPDVAKPFGLNLVLRDLVLDDAVWSLFDPTGQLPRDAATLVVDVDGTAEMAVDVLDPEAVAGLGEQPPGELETLSLNEIRLALAGAELRAVGELAFPTPDPSQPVGAITLNLDGAFALADRLVALGVLPAEQVAFLRGMSGAVASPVGDDQLESRIEFTEGGGISANGMPLR